MIVLLAIGFVAGVVTAVSPCVLPVLPIVLAGGASGESKRRPYAIIAGLVASFTVFTLSAAWLLRKLGLPDNFLRNLALVLLFVLAASLVFAPLGELLERPFERFSRRRGGDLGGGFLLGASLGLVFVPCAGPVLTVITVKAASMHVGWKTVALTLAYALGAAVPMLVVARGGQAAARRLRPHAPRLRIALGLVIALAAVAIAFHLDTKAQVALGDYTNALQGKVERNSYAKRKLRDLGGGGNSKLALAADTGAPLQNLGRAPEFHGISHWLNTPGERPLTMAGLRGKVVLIDFWTYSCINCLRTLPHVETWAKRYRNAGLVVVGVHSPEFAFEHVLSNVRSADERLGVKYPVALDNDLATWNAYSNQYWPAEYLVDRQGEVRHAHFGEGEYDQTEALIRRLLEDRPGVQLPPLSQLADATPSGLVTPETYLGYERIDPERYVGTPVKEDKPAHYSFVPYVAQNNFSYDGLWKVGSQELVAVHGARLRLHFHAQHVYLVLSGKGTVARLVDGKPAGTTKVRGARLYTMLDLPKLKDGVLELRFSPGVAGYAFTFG